MASIQIRGGRAVAWIYNKAWARYGLHWFDHRFDFLSGPQSWYWQERGVLGSQAIRPGDKVLDLCCGEGFYDLTYFSRRAGRIDALDIDSRAIQIASFRNHCPNVNFYLRDVVHDDFPDTNYDAVLCFSALQQLTETQLDDLLRKIPRILKPSGLFFGSVSVTPDNGVFVSEDRIRSPFSRYFQSIELNFSPWPNGRIEWYFRCQRPLSRHAASQPGEIPQTLDSKGVSV
jgi:ubiquinone/menaquinone biosynthesis C-methylase UbiE